MVISPDSLPGVNFSEINLILYRGHLSFHLLRLCDGFALAHLRFPSINALGVACHLLVSVVKILFYVGLNALVLVMLNVQNSVDGSLLLRFQVLHYNLVLLDLLLIVIGVVHISLFFWQLLYCVLWMDKVGWGPIHLFVGGEPVGILMRNR
jgi:hypothetical protein